MYGVLAISAMLSVVELTVASVMTSEDFRETNGSDLNLAFYDSEFVFSHMLRILENIALLVGVIRFHIFVRNTDNSFRKMYFNLKNGYNFKKCGLLLIIIFTCSHFITHLTPISFYIHSEKPFSFRRAYSGTIIFVVFTDWIKQVSIIIVTTMVRSIWIMKLKKLKKAKKRRIEGGKKCAKDLMLVIQDSINDYKETSRSVARLHGIFKHWFVMVWLIFFTSIVFDSSLTFQILLWGNLSGWLWARGLLLLADIIAFVTPFICGNVMNRYQNTCHRKVEKATLHISCMAQPGETALVVQRGKMLLPRPNKYQFIPSLYCKVPFDNPGYILSILVALVSFLFTISIKLCSVCVCVCVCV